MPAFAVTPEQQDLRASVRRFLADRSPEAEVRRLSDTEQGFDPDVWKRMAGQLGLQGLGIPEEFGGAGAGHVELGIVLEEMGRALLCAPFLSTVGLAANLLLTSGDRAAQARYLPGIAEGGTVATVAVSAAGLPGAGVVARRTDDGWRLTGTEPYVLDGHVADLVLVPARTTAGVALFAVEREASGLGRTLLTTADRTRRQARLTFTDTPGAPLDGGLPAMERMLDLAAIALASEQAGGAARALEMSVGYAKTRVQFGRAIGSFQAVKHLCADLLLESESATSAARYAASAADEDAPDLPALASLVRFSCSDSFVKVAADTIQIHGGIGFTWEHPAHLYLRRARTSALLLGDPAFHRERYLRRTGV
jgi:alkylation response protein AidB-like acyl-CoA dehydrogenase